MKERGLVLHIVTSAGPELEAFGRREQVDTAAVDMPRRVTPLRDIRAVIRIAREIRRIRPAIVHAHTPKGGLLGMIAGSLCRVPVRIYHMRGLPMLGAAGYRRRLLWFTEWLACSLAHRILCVSHSVRTEAVTTGICPASKIAVLLGGSGNGVDAQGRFNPSYQSPEVRLATRRQLGIGAADIVVGFVGRVVRDKGLVELASAWQVLRAQHTHLRLLIVGPFEPGDPLPAETLAVLHSDPHVHLTGMDWETPPLYAAMDIVVLPTYREGFPNVPLEAAAMGLPVVATRIPGCVDAVADEVSGILVPPRNPSALTLAIDAYVRDPALRRQHGRAGRERVLREFRQEAIWNALFSEYQRLLKDRDFSFDLGERGSGAVA